MRRAIRAILCIGCIAALTGCEGEGGLRMGRSAGPGESILEILGPPSPAEIVAWASDPYDATKRQRGILALANMAYGGEPVYVDLYVLAMDDGDAAVRSAAARALSLHGEPEHAPMLAARLKDESVLVRREAARALQRLHNEAVIDPLMDAMDWRRETDGDVRERAASALGQYARPDVVQSLISGLQDRLLRVNLVSESSLQTLTGQDLGDEPAAWVRWANSAPDLFADQQEYIFPVFYRDPTLAEKLLPWRRAPNEAPGVPVGMPPVHSG